MSPSLSYHIQGIFQDVEHGVSTNPWGSFPFSSPLPLSPSFPHEAGGRGRGCCAKVGGINPPEGGVGNSLKGTVHTATLRCAELCCLL